MNKAVHILRKDLLRLRLPAMLFVALVVAFVVLDVTYMPGAESATEIPRAAVEVLLVLLAWWLVAGAVHQEPLTGDREFWPTRPYGRGSLLVAKLMVLGVTISLPLLLADCAILGLQGLPVFTNAGGLGLRVVATALWLMVPALALAALTANATQYALGWFLVAVYAVLLVQWKGESPFLNDDYAWNIVWVLAGLSAVILAVCVVLQYRGFGLVRGRVVFAVALLPPMIPVNWDMALGLQRQLPEAQRAERIQIAADPGRITQVTNTAADCIDIPVTVTGLEEGWQMVTLGGSAVFRTGSRKMHESFLHRKDDGYWQTACAGEPIHGKTAVDLTVVLALTTEEPRSNVQIRQNVVSEAGVGTCRVVRFEREGSLLCSAAVRPPARGSVQMGKDSGGERDISYFQHSWAPLGVLPGFSPVFKWICLPDHGAFFGMALNGAFVDLSFVKRRPIAFLKRTYTVRDVETGMFGK
jgi:hypothetical protein